MPVFEDICRGLAANLAVLDGYQISPWFLDNPTPDAIQVSGAADIDYDVAFENRGVSHDMWNIEIEACLQRTVDISAQLALAKLISPDSEGSLKAALEADQRLTKRYLDDMSVLGDQAPACDDLHVLHYRGTARHTLEGGFDVLLATWTVQVLT